MATVNPTYIAKNPDPESIKWPQCRDLKKYEDNASKFVGSCPETVKKPPPICCDNTSNEPARKPPEEKPKEVRKCNPTEPSPLWEKWQKCREKTQVAEDPNALPKMRGNCPPYTVDGDTCPPYSGQRKPEVPCHQCNEVTKLDTLEVDKNVSKMVGGCPMDENDPDFKKDNEEYERICGIPAKIPQRNMRSLVEQGICPVAIGKEGEPGTSDYYKTCRLPARFEYPSCFHGFGCQRRPPEHPFYRTTSLDYGWYPPTIHSVPTSFFPTNQAFTRTQGIGGMYRNYGLNLKTKEDEPFVG